MVDNNFCIVYTLLVPFFQETHRPASQLVRDFMREFVQNQREKREHDAWFKREVQASTDSPSSAYTHEQAMTEMKSRLAARIAKEKKQ